MKAAHYSYLDKAYPLAIAHRGGAGEWPENSSAAFRAAYDLGYRYMETDVHLSLDGEVVAFHDPTLDRLGGESVAIQARNWSQIKNIELQGGGNVPLMRDLFSQLPDAYFNIDMKCNEVVRPLIALVKECQAEARVCLASFVDHRVATVRRAFNNAVCVSAGRYGVTLQVARSKGLPWSAPKAAVLQVPLRQAGIEIVTAGFLERCRKDGKHVHVWTIDQPAQMHRLLDLGVDGIITDQPAVLRQVLEERGQWVCN